MPVRPHRREIEELSQRFPEQVTIPGHPDYDARRSVLWDRDDCRPAALVRVSNTHDIAETIRFARRHGFELAIRSGGHSNSGHGTVDGGIVIDMRALDSVAVDAAARSVWVGGGATAGAVLRALAPHSQVIGFGDTADVGVGGIVTGGGVGYLSRLLGITADSLLAAEVVLASGEIVLANPNSEPDLFWAIRGGGGNFGVLSRMQFRTHALPEFTGGHLVLPATAQAIAGFAAAAQAAPEQLSAIANVMPAPPAPFISPAQRDGLVMFATMAFAGAPDAAKAALAPFRALATPLLDTVKPGPFLDLLAGDGWRPPGLPEARTLFVDRIHDHTAQTVIGFLTESDSPVRAVQARVLGGAVNRVAPGETAYGHRSSQIMLNLANFYLGDEDRPRRRKWADDLLSALQQGDTGAYVNFLGEEGAARIRSAYPGPTWDRLRRIKRQYDPENLFRRNQNIPPASP